MVSNSLRRVGAAQPVLEKSWKLEKMQDVGKDG
jgi:hypothetical protein